jgi:TolA-binding protein
MSSTILRFVAPVLAASIVATTPIPAVAQDGVSEARLRKVEAEVRALQRRVFPGGEGRFFEPQINSGETAEGAAATNPNSTTAVTDILARLDALELQLQRLTAESEVNSNSIAGLDMRLRALEGTGANSSTSNGTPLGTTASTASVPSTSVAASSTPAPTPAPSPAPSPAASGPSAERLSGVQAITKPQTDDAADDEYSYGFRLWNAGYYPEAQQQLSKFVEEHPSHWRTTYGRNLLGRAYLDNNQAREAAPWFLRNYQTDKQAARAGDSLLYLAEAMIALEDTSRACIALSEFGETYPALASGRLSDQYERNRKKVSC